MTQIIFNNPLLIQDESGNTTSIPGILVDAWRKHFELQAIEFYWEGKNYVVPLSNISHISW
jgi:hypothetical protein